MRPLLVVPVLLVMGLACNPSASTPTTSASPTPQASDAQPAEPPKPAPTTAAADPHEAEVAPVAVEAKIGAPAPDFSLPDLDGNTHTLAQHRGKTVVLEWFNPECPFVNFAHTKGPLVDMAKRVTATGVVWLAINSGGAGKQGHGVEANRKGVETYAMGHPVLLDPNGEVGHRYGAQKTPHMFVVDPKGVLVYAGAIDNAPFGETQGGAAPINYVDVALQALGKGEAIETAETPSYGCTVKYGQG